MRFIRLFWLVIAMLLLSGVASAAEPSIAVIVTPAHAKSIKKEDLMLMFRRKKLFWNDGSKVQPANLPASNPLRKSFSQAVLGVAPEELEKYWNDMYFHGISPPYIVASEEAMLRFVVETPGAIGYVSFCSADDRVAVALVINPDGRITSDTTSIACPR
jgi:hypothetical protein